MSDTPRTDAAIEPIEIGEHEGCSETDGPWVTADFARQLERELAETNRTLLEQIAVRDRYRSERDTALEVLRTAHDEISAVVCDPQGTCCIDGSDGDRRVIDNALGKMRKAQCVHQLRRQ